MAELRHLQYAGLTRSSQTGPLKAAIFATLAAVFIGCASEPTGPSEICDTRSLHPQGGSGIQTECAARPDDGVVVVNSDPPPPAEVAFSFVQISDAQPASSGDQARFEEVLDEVVAAGQPGALLPRPVEFVLFAGDLVSGPTSQSGWTTFVNTMDTKLTANGIPYRAVPGNHDGTSGGDFSNYEQFIAPTAVWDTDIDVVTGHNGQTVATGWRGLRIIGINNTNGGFNQISAADLADVDQRVTAASAANENVFLLVHHPHNETGSIPLATSLENLDVIGYLRGHAGSPHANQGLSGISNPNVWDLSSHDIEYKQGILYYEVYANEIKAYVLRLDQNPTSLPAPVTVQLQHPLTPTFPPTADFSASPIAGSTPFTVDFTDLSSGAPTGWSWDFGDGNTSTEQHPTHVYTTPDVYTVSLTATNTVGGDTHTKTAYVTVTMAAGGDVTFLGAVTGGSSSAASATSAPVTVSPGRAYVVTVASKPFEAVTSMTGLGGSWSLVAAQCGGRSQTGVSVFVTTDASASGTVTANLAGTTSNTVMSVAEYSGVDLGNPIGAVNTANTVGEAGPCSGGSDTSSYTMPLTTTSASSLVVGAIALRNKTNTPDPGWTQQIDAMQGGGGGAAGMAVFDQTISSPGPIAVSGTTSSSVDWALAAFELRAGAGGSTVPEIVVTPSALAFEPVGVGGFADLDVTVTNVGNGALSITAPTGTLSTPEFSVQAGGGSFTLDPGLSHTVTVRFAPSAVTSFNGILTITSDDADEASVDVLLNGDGVTPAPEITVSPAALNFGTDTVGGSTDLDITITNDGTGGLAITVPSGTLATPEFSVVAGGGAHTVNQGTSHTVTVRFAPSSAASFSGTLTITSNDPDEGSVGVALSGDGMVPEPEITVSPLALGFGSVLVGSATDLTVTITNDGTAVLSVTVPTGPLPTPEFSVEAGGGSITVDPGMSHTVTVRFAPSSVTTFLGTLTITSNDADEGSVDVSLSGDGVVDSGGQVVFEGYTTGGASSAAAVASGPITVSTNRLYVVTVVSKPYQTVTGVSGLGGNWSLTATQCGGRSQTGVTVFVSTDASASGTVTANLAGSVSNVAMTVAEYSGVDLTNPTGAVNTVNTVGEAGPCSGGSDGSSYTMSLSTTSASSLVVGAIALRNKTHTPGAGWAQLITTMQGTGGGAAGMAVFDQEISSPGPVTVSGTTSSNVDWAVAAIELRAGAAGPPVPEIAVTPMTLGFGTVGTGNASDLDVTITNEGTAGLAITVPTGPLATPEFSVEAGGGSFTVNPGMTHTVTVRFVPSSATSFNETLTIVSDDADEGTVDVALSGTGVTPQPEITVAPTALNFGTVGVGAVSDLVVTITNEGTGGLAITVPTGPLSTAEFSVEAGGGSVTVDPGMSHAVTVRFTPTSATSFSETLTITSNDADEGSVDVALSGDGVTVAPEITVTPLALAFGTVFVGGTADLDVTITNDGTAGLAITVPTGPLATAEFSVEVGGGSFTVDPGMSHTVTVRFTPSSETSFAGTLQVTSNDADEGTVDVGLSGDGSSTPAEITFEGYTTGGSTSSASVASGAVTFTANRVYVVTVATKPAQAVTSVSGLGGSWSLSASQCAGRNQTGVNVFVSTDAATSGAVTATLAGAPSNAVISVAQYSGVDMAAPIGAVNSANTVGEGGPCTGGSDSSSYTMPLTTTGASSLVVGAIALRNRVHTPGTGWIQQIMVEQGSGGGIAGMAVFDQAVAAAGPVTVAGSLSGSVDWALAAIELKAAAGGQP